ncbi:FAD:protein FMN transferase [Prevotella sp. E15-22]|uniref:FAD:protein FMN transferase n=1 Tax=Prevotella sp. E15-22 TaxID=2937774 RepID=UPI0035310CA5
MRRIVFLLLTVALLMGCSKPMPFQRHSNFVFGTVYNITYQYDKDLQKEIEAELMKVDAEFSMFNKESTVARINRGDSTVERSEMFNEIYQLAQTVSNDTYGAFDITVAPLVNAWGFGFKHEQLPTAQQVDSLMRIRNQMDFSAIAKGYGCDVVARLLKSKGINNYMVEIGGEVVVSGHNDKDQLWHIGVNKPVDDSTHMENELQTVLSITDHAMATSGNYRNFYYQNGKKYAHTIDPRTGYPVQHSLLSATVIADNCATADAYATSFMVLGVDGAKEVLLRHPELMAYLIYVDEDGQMAVWSSPALKDYEQ